ncbi:MAG: rhamnan synthesis F family protein, partial [Anaerolineales bacterium]
ALLGSPEKIRRIFALMQGQHPCGIVYPQNYVLLPYWANTWLANRELGRMWAARLGLGEIPRGYFDYPLGSMFWARSDALAPLFKAGFAWDDFPEEAGQTDGTLAHTIERLFVLSSLSRGMPPAILRDEQIPSWSPWRFDLYVTRPYDSLVSALHSPRVKLIAFDIFDTLFCRPLLDPETVKRIIARRLGGELGALYQRYRHTAEQQARYEKKRDVNLNEIYGQFGQLTSLSESELMNLQRLEEDVEELLLEPRWEALQLYREALATGKPVVLITDMFLPRERLEVILRKHGISGWKYLFVSGEIGFRKDDGRLYEYVLAKYELKPAEFLMIGDDERSDVQIPCDMGAPFVHLMRP